MRSIIIGVGGIVVDLETLEETPQALKEIQEGIIA
jgi:hypothetical protein